MRGSAHPWLISLLMALFSAAALSTDWEDLWFLPAQDSTHDIYNAKQMSKKNESSLEKQTWMQPTAKYMHT